MKIGILTYHACYNYGANFQAYALQKTINNLGHECDIIDYRNKELNQVNSVLNFHIKNKFDLAFLIYNALHFWQLKKRKEKFETFIKKHLKLSLLCSSDSAVEDCCGQYNLIVCGSDQIWNTNPKIKYNSKVYFLNFPKKQKRISYAASFGTNVIFENNKVKKEFLEYLATFDHLLVREENAVAFLKTENLQAQKVLDPTLLLESSDYRPLINDPKISKSYIITLNWNGRRFVSDLAEKISHQLNIKLVNPISHPRNIFNKAQLLLGIGPQEFLGLIDGASFIVSSSFHAVVFAIQFRKPFIAVMNNKEHDFTTTDDRLVSLLGDLGLSNNIVYDINDVDLEKIMHTDYDAVHERLNKYRKESINLLINALNN